MELHDNAELQDDLGAFEAALHAKVKIPEPKPAVVLLALDDSSQDLTARAIAAHVAAARRSGGHRAHDYRSGPLLPSACRSCFRADPDHDRRDPGHRDRSHRRNPARCHGRSAQHRHERMIAETDDTRGHGTHTWAKFWKDDLVQLLARTN